MHGFGMLQCAACFEQVHIACSPKKSAPREVAGEAATILSSGATGDSAADANQHAILSIAGQNEIFDQRIHLIPPAVTAEYAVVAGAGLQMMTSLIRPEIATQIVRRDGLADGTDVVALAFDREQSGAPDCAGINASPLPLELAARQRVLLEYQAYRL